MFKNVLIGIVFTSFLLMLPLAFAQETAPLASSSLSVSPVEYTLPYAGILPDHPLFFLKRLRDQILLILITHPVRKVEFYILLSDKYMNMSAGLLAKNKPTLALKTAEQSIGYLKQAEKQVFEIASGGNSEVANVKERLEKSLAKHIQEIRMMYTLLPVDQKMQLDRLNTNTDQLYQDFLHRK